jgi:hypothetical protein
MATPPREDFRVCCLDCDASGPVQHNRADAASRWNRVQVHDRGFRAAQKAAIGALITHAVRYEQPVVRIIHDELVPAVAAIVPED